ncbi:MAG: TonB-dependent receptor, partial [Cytophagaceae bacterium]|nr:TonB-dependent receptor [Cytophagaceae bacterium]
IQQVYSQGANDKFNQTGLFSWGSKIDQIGTYTNLLGESEQAAAYRHDKAFYKTGTTLVSGLDVSQGGALGSYSIGASQTRQTGIIPNSGLRRTNFKINGQFTPYERFKVGLSLNYSDLKVDDYPDETGNVNYFRALTDAPPSYNLAGKIYASPNDPYQQIFFRAGQNNPYWIINNNFRTAKTARTFGNVFAEYRLAEGLKFVYRIGLDQFTTRLVNYAELGTGPIGRTLPPSGGALALVNTTETQVNSNAFLTFDKTFGKDWTLNAIAGNELYDIRTTVDRANGSNFVAGNWASLSNATTVTASNVLSRQRVVGFYGNLNLGWKDRIFLSASGRNDYVSNMPAAQRSFFYPSVGLSAVLTDLVPALQGDVVNFAKLRANVAQVGQAGPLFVNGVGYVQRNPSGQGTGAFLFPFNGITAFTPSLTAINPDIRPENTKSLEAGFEVKLLKNRISVDYTYFRSRSDGQILSVPLPISSGASSEIRNAGKLSSFGHEVVLTLVPLKTSRFEWTMTTNFTLYRTFVDQLPDGLARITLSDANAGLVLNVAQKGERYPALYGRGYARAPAPGQLVMNAVGGQPTTGVPLLDNVAKIVGTPAPDFEVNFINGLRFGPVALSVQVDWRQGGQFWSVSQVEARWRGLAAETLSRDEQVVLPGKKGRFTNGQLVVEGDNDISIFRKVDYYNSLYNNAEANLNDASFVRLRELNLAFELPTSGFLKKSLGLSSASLFLTGRNLFLITNAFTDPELNMSNLPGSSAENSAGIEWSQQPQTRSWGAGLRLRW